LTLSEYINELNRKLLSIYDKEEAASVSKYYVESILSLNSTELILKCNEELIPAHLDKLKTGEIRLINGEPVQYITGKSWFYGLNFFVNKNVLIPRQETEILVDYIIKRHKNSGKIKILDIGTGSGCIAITLKKYLSNAEIFAIDVSANVLEICKKNAQLNKVNIEVLEYNILYNKNLPFNKYFDIILSNPPYVLESEKPLMHKNVVDFEPAQALYVEDKDPLLFYRNILERISESATKPREIFFEINEKFSNEIISLNKSFGFLHNEIIKDLNGKDRFVFGLW
jgi:release factor glutamine methyltransferase